MTVNPSFALNQVWLQFWLSFNPGLTLNLGFAGAVSSPWGWPELFALSLALRFGPCSYILAFGIGPSNLGLREPYARLSLFAIFFSGDESHGNKD